MQGYQQVADRTEVVPVGVLALHALPSCGAFIVKELIGRDEGNHLRLHGRILV